MKVPFFLRAYAWISAAAGSSAFWIGVVWFVKSWDHGLQIPPPLPDDLMDLDALYSLNLAGILFDFGVPPLCLTSFVFGFPARRHPAAKAGLLLAGAASIVYLVYLRSWLSVLGP